MVDRFGRALGAFLLAAALWAGWTAPAAAFDPMLETRIAQAVDRGDIDAAIRMVETALAQADDPRLTEDLLARGADLLSRAGRHGEAAAMRLRLVERVAQREGEALGLASGALSPELIPLLADAARDHERAGERILAVELLDRALGIARAAGLADAAEPLIEQLSALGAALDDAAGERAETIIAAHRETARRLAEETSRSIFLDPEKAFSTVTVYYATDRAREGKLPNDFYGGGRGQLELGTATVSIPENHRPGQIEKPSVWTLDFREDPERHVVLLSVTPDADDAVFSRMRDHVRETGSEEAFVFVHGFNVPFHEAAKRTAQMAYDMNFDGLPILYSWPSRGSIMSYIADTAVVNLSGRRLSLFLEDLVAQSGATRIHLIGHSMGNRALTDALELFALRHRGPMPAFDQVLFTAPDLDAGLFAEMMHTMRPAANRITLYASDRDWALAVSRQLHGDSPRAGQGGRGIVHMADIDSIDMTDIGDDMLKHSYFANNPSALTDILSLFWRDAPPDQRCGMTLAEGDNGAYWQYSPSACDTETLLPTLSFLRRGAISTMSDARLFVNRYIIPTTADQEKRSNLDNAIRRLFGG
jgi:esterase/lipase superfamily enzyme